MKDSNPKDVIGCKKPPVSTVSEPVLFEVGAAMLEGALKYGRHNYREIGVRSSVYFDAARRHLGDWWEGEDTDPDSGLPHISKAIASLVVLRDAQMQGREFDDRPPKAAKGWMARISQLVTEILERYPDPKEPFTEKGTETSPKPKPAPETFLGTYRGVGIFTLSPNLTDEFKAEIGARLAGEEILKHALKIRKSAKPFDYGGGQS